MKKLTASILTLIALVVFAPVASVPAAEPSNAHILTNQEFDALLAQPERLVVVDVRRPDELTKYGGFPVYLSIQLGDLGKNLAYIPKDRTVVTVSNNSTRAGRAADLLAAKGFKVAGAIGAKKYEEAGGKLTKIIPPATEVAGANQPTATAH